MKKVLTIVLVAAVLVSSVFAYSNQQKIYSVDSGVYEAMETLFILSGRSLPSSSGPWSEAELQLMLSYIDKNALSESAQAYYDYVESLITSNPKRQYEDNFAMEFGLDLTLEGYFHTNDKFDNFDKWFHSYTDRTDFLNLTFEAWPAENFYGYFEFTLGTGLGYEANNCDPSITKGNSIFQSKLTINVPVIEAMLFTKEDMFDNFNWTFPERAFVSVGGEHWNVMAGRDKLSWGAGETGNLMLSDHFPSHTMVRFNTFFEAFKYSVVGTMYPVQPQSSQFNSLDGFKSLVAHRLEFNMFKGKVQLVVNEACMFWSKQGEKSYVVKDKDGNNITITVPDNQSFNLGQINPFGFMHNEYIPINANSLLVFELNYTPIKGINIYGQVAIDEFQGPGEPKVNPSAFGFLAGIKAATATNGGILSGSLEFAKTDPYLYIRGINYDEKNNKGYGYDAIYRSFCTGGIIDTRMFTTYKYGNDVMLFDGKINFEIPGKLNIGFEGLYMLHGSMNVNSVWGQYKTKTSDKKPIVDSRPIVTSPTEYNVFDPNDVTYDHKNNTYTIDNPHAIEQRVVLSLTADYKIAKGLSANLAADFIFIKNMNNVADNNQNDTQITLGIKYEI